jgi:RNA polymerase sigma factor (sigma-70 family)
MKSPDPPPPVAGGLADRGSGEDTFRRRMVEEALVSVQLRDGIEVILLRYRRRGYRWDELLAETGEVRNEVALRALDCLSSFDHRRAAPLPWLMGIATNVLRERRRWYAREAQHRLPQSSCSEEKWQDILNQLSTEPHPSAEPGLVWQAFALLNEEQQRILRLRLLEERCYSEIAHCLGISKEAVRARVCRALRELRAHLTHLEQRRNGE